MTTVEIIVLVVLIDVFILAAIGMYFVVRNTRRQRELESQYAHDNMNLMATSRDSIPSPPTLEHIQNSIGNHRLSSMKISSRRSSERKSFEDEYHDNDDEEGHSSNNDDEEDDNESKNDLVNVAII